jgi:hypothetical protein
LTQCNIPKYLDIQITLFTKAPCSDNGGYYLKLIRNLDDIEGKDEERHATAIIQE